jgi:hypothetical protein
MQAEGGAGEGQIRQGAPVGAMDADGDLLADGAGGRGVVTARCSVISSGVVSMCSRCSPTSGGNRQDANM